MTLLINIITITTMIIIIMVIIAFDVTRTELKLNMRSLGTRTQQKESRFLGWFNHRKYIIDSTG